MVSTFLKIFRFFWKSPRERMEAKATLVSDLASFEAECKSWLIDLHNLRRRHSGVGINDDVRAHLVNMSKQDAVAQKLQWDFKKEFGNHKVVNELSELMRRIALTKQVLRFGSFRFRNAAFPHGLMWIECQAAKVLKQASSLAQVNLNDPQAPLIAGLLPLGMTSDERYTSHSEPWLDVQEQALKEEIEELKAGRDPYS